MSVIGATYVLVISVATSSSLQTNLSGPSLEGKAESITSVSNIYIDLPAKSCCTHLFFSYYLKAQQLAPKDGKPYNQLAVIAINAVSFP